MDTLVTKVKTCVRKLGDKISHIQNDLTTACSRIDQLETHNKELIGKIDFMKNEAIKNNCIFGLTEEIEENVVKQVLFLSSYKLGVAIFEKEISNYYQFRRK